MILKALRYLLILVAMVFVTSSYDPSVSVPTFNIRGIILAVIALVGAAFVEWIEKEE